MSSYHFNTTIPKVPDFRTSDGTLFADKQTVEEAEYSRYAVGWYTPWGAELEALPPEYREQCKAIECFGHAGNACLHSTPCQAQRFLEQIIKNNSATTVAQFCGGSADAMFIVEVVPTGKDWPRFSYRKYKGSDQIIHEPPKAP